MMRIRNAGAAALFFAAALAYGLALELLQHLVLQYRYGDLGPVFNGIPLAVPLGWAIVWSLAFVAGQRLGRGWVAASVIGGLVAAALAILLETGAVAAGWWTWGERPAAGGVPWLVPFQAFSAGITFLLGYGLVAQMRLPDLRIQVLFLILTLAPLLFVHLEFVFVLRLLLHR